MKEKDLFKKSIDDNILDKKEILDYVLENDIKKNHFFDIKLFKLATLAVTLILIFISLCSFPLSDDVTVSNNSFSIIAYASDSLPKTNEGSHILNTGCLVIINDGVTAVSSGGVLVCEGTSIDEVTFSSERGSFLNFQNVVTVNSGEGVSYFPAKSEAEFSNLDFNNLKFLPKDIVNVKVRFKNGDVAFKTLILYFNEENNLVIEMK